MGQDVGRKAVLLFHCDVIGCHRLLSCRFHFKVEIKFAEHKIHASLVKTQLTNQSTCSYCKTKCTIDQMKVGQISRTNANTHSHTGEERDL